MSPPNYTFSVFSVKIYWPVLIWFKTKQVRIVTVFQKYWSTLIISLGSDLQQWIFYKISSLSAFLQCMFSNEYKIFLKKLESWRKIWKLGTVNCPKQYIVYVAIFTRSKLKNNLHMEVVQITVATKIHFTTGESWENWARRLYVIDNIIFVNEPSISEIMMTGFKRDILAARERCEV